jgi:hypothetical protein
MFAMRTHVHIRNMGETLTVLSAMRNGDHAPIPCPAWEGAVVGIAGGAGEHE